MNEKEASIVSGDYDFVITLEDGVLKQYTGPGGDVVIPEGVTAIGWNAFSDCTGVTSVTIPEGVTELDVGAFDGCTGLTSVTIPASVRKMYAFCFRDCIGLTSVVIPEGVTSMEDGVFQDCTGLTSVTIPAGVKTIGREVFSGCTGLTSITLPESVTEVGTDAFDKTPWLEQQKAEHDIVYAGRCVVTCRETLAHAEIKDGTRYICNNAFRNRTAMTSVVLPEGVTEIGWWAFQGCTSLASVRLPGSLTMINEAAFSGCKSLTSVTIPAGVKWIDGSEFSGCTSLTSVTILGKTEIWKEAFSDHVSVIVAEQLRMGDYPLPIYKQAAARGFALRYGSGETLPEDYRADCLKYIRGQKKKLYPMALQFPPLLHVMLGEKMVPKGDLPDLIDQAASLNKPEVTAMLLDYQDRQLKPGEREQMEAEKMQREMDFMLTGALTAAEAKKSWRYEKDEKGNLTILGYKGKETEVEVPTAIGKDPVTAIGDYAFSPNGKPLSEVQRAARRNIRSIRVPEGVETIGKSAFEDCAGLEQVELPASVRKIGGSSYLPDGYKPKPQKTDDPFSGCTALTMVLVAEDNRWYCVEDGLFCRKSKTGQKMLGYVGDTEGVCIVPEGSKTIPDYFFQKRVSLTAVSLPEGVDEIGNFAFRDCTGLISVTIPEGVSKIGRNAFSGCTSLTSVILPTSMTAIDEYAFFGCTSLTGMTIPEGVSKIGRKAFSGCTSLTNVMLPTSVTTIDEETFSSCTSLTSVTIPVGVQEIGKSAFWCCTNLASVTIPESVTEIGDVAFRGCTSLSSIIIREGVVRIGQTAFGETPWLEQQKAEHGMVYAGRCVVACRETLAHAEIKDGTRYICNHAFRECTALTSVVIPEGVTEIDWCAFDGCTGLTSVTIPASVTEIGWWAFHGCEHLTIHAPAGSYAQQYAQRNNIRFEEA